MNVSFTAWPDLAVETLGGRAIVSSDEFFAPKENLVRSAQPVFVADRYTDCGKWMDGWETRRRRSPGFDYCVVELGLRGVVRGVVVDTSFFKGNFPEYCSIDGTDSQAMETAQWRTLVSKQPLCGDALNAFAVNDPSPVSMVRLNIYPDGGVARLRVHGEVAPEKLSGLVDFAALANGGSVVAASDMFFGHKDHLIFPGRSQFMGGGWETRRRRGPGYDWIIVRLARVGNVRRIEIDTDHYRGNFPESASVEGLYSDGELDTAAFRDSPLTWLPLLSQTKLKADHGHVFEKEIVQSGDVNYIRLCIYPDGGIARLRVFCNA